MAYVNRADGAPDRAPPLMSGDDGNVVRFRRSESGLAGVPSPIDLAQLIEGEIIPRLLAAHQSGGRHEVIPMDMGVVTPAELESFARQTMTMDLSALVDQVELLVRRGVSVEGIYFDLLSPSARLLGDWWEQDVCTFADVTVGLCRLQQLVYQYADRVHVEDGGGDGRTALFALTPGDQHSLGLIMVVEYFRQAGWRTICMPDATAQDLEDIVQTERFDLIGFSMANERWLEPLTPLISRLRAVSRNASVRVMVGGRAFAENPDRVAMVGADQTATDAREAVQAAARLFASQHSAA